VRFAVWYSISAVMKAMLKMKIATSASTSDIPRSAERLRWAWRRSKAADFLRSVVRVFIAIPRRIRG
jgi:hypothetical protein